MDTQTYKKVAFKRTAMSSIFPISQDAIAQIAADMSENGYDAEQPILLWKGEDEELGVLDGWHRYQAALRAGVEPVFETLTLSRGGALGLIINRNSRRRHLNKEQIVAAEVVIARASGRGATEAELIAHSKAAASTVQKLMTAPNEDLQKLVDGDINTREVRSGNDQKSTNQRRRGRAKQAECIPLLVRQQARIASINSVLNEKPADLNKAIVDAGIVVFEEKRDEVIVGAK